MRLAVSCAAAVLALGVFGAPASADPGDSPVPETTDGGGRVTVGDDPSILSPRAVRIESWSRNASTDALSVHFTLPSPGCTGAHATVTETADSVSIDLREGTIPAAVGRVCAMIVESATLDVPLRAPVADRVVLSRS